MSNMTIESMKKRRSIYHLGEKLPVSKESVVSTIQDAARYTPSAFNSQSARLLVLFGEESRKLWSIVKDALRPIVPEPQWPETEQRIGSFAAGAGTVLFFEDMAVIKGLQEQMPLYAENFALWSHHGTGMTQLSVWTALANISVGASLQHYGNLIENQVKKTWDLPDSYSLIAQMPFGSIESPAEEKQSMPIEERVKVLG
jgi:predicted oxidoreductase (fatty acid repression mutant protein)